MCFCYFYRCLSTILLRAPFSLTLLVCAILFNTFLCSGGLLGCVETQAETAREEVARELRERARRYCFSGTENHSMYSSSDGGERNDRAIYRVRRHRLLFFVC